MRSLVVLLIVVVAVASAQRDPRCAIFRPEEEVPQEQEGNFWEVPIIQSRWITNEPQYMPHPDDCSRFYVCDRDGHLIEASCPWNLEFNPETLRCEDQLGVCQIQSARVDDHLCYGHPDGKKFATNNCNSFIICENAKGVLQSCDFGLLFNQNTEICDWAENVHCGELVGPPQGAAPSCVGREGDYLPNPYDCASFYVCEHNAALLYHCDYGLHFDTSISTCNWKDNVQCVVENLPEQHPHVPVREMFIFG